MALLIHGGSPGRDERLLALFIEPLRSLDELLDRLPIADHTTLMGGGSNARVYEFNYAATTYVVKFVRAGTALVDGHDATTLSRKADQIAWIHQYCPRLAGRIAAPILVYRGDDGCALVMHHEAGYPLIQLLKDANSPAEFFDVLAPILTDLIEHGYSTSTISAASGSFARMHPDRIERRLKVIRDNLDRRLLDGAVRINGRSCPGLEDVLADLRARPALLAALDPPVLHFPVHGDLNAGNLFRRENTGKGGYFMLDPRGIVEHWDAMYDMGKLLFSLAGLHAGMHSGFAVQRCTAGIEVKVRSGQTHVFESAADRFPEFLASLPAFGRLIEGDPHWLLRLHMTTAMHMLAEVACRFSDTKPRTTPANRGHAAQAELATGLYAMGVLSAEHLLRLDDARLLSGTLTRPNWQEPGP